MRAKIIESIEQAKSQRARQQSWSTQNFGLGQVPIRDYTFMLSSEQQFALKQIKTKLKTLQTSLQKIFDKTSVEVGTATSLEVQGEGLVVIELSLYGDLASLFRYGDVPLSTLEKIKGCLEENGLAWLFEEEQVELEQQGSYHDLF